MLKRRYRYAIELLVVVVAVGIGLFLFSKDNVRERSAPPSGPAPPSETWQPSAKYDAEANADFAVENSATGNVALAGKDTGADWPTFNGPRRDNKSSETSLLPRWPSGGPKLAWMSRGLGAGYSSVSVVKGVVYTMGNKGASEAVIALDAGTGQKIWSTPFCWAAKLSAGDGPRSTPTFSEGAVYALGGYGDLVCLDASSGAIRWQKNILQEFGGQNLTWGICESVLVDDNRVICTPGGDKATLVALDRQSGDVLWKSLLPDKDRASYASAVVAEVGGIRQYVQLTGERHRGRSSRHGRISVARKQCGQRHGELFVAFGRGQFRVQLLQLRHRRSPRETCRGRLEGDGRTRLPHPRHDQPSRRHGDRRRPLLRLERSRRPDVPGTEHRQSRNGGAARRAKARSPTPTAGSISAPKQGIVALIEATGEAYRELGRFEQPHRSPSSAWSHPVVAAGKLFLCDQDLLVLLRLEEGRVTARAWSKVSPASRQRQARGTSRTRAWGAGTCAFAGSPEEPPTPPVPHRRPV